MHFLEEEEMGKHAYLIMCHTGYGQLKKLLELLDDTRNDIFLMVDKKQKDERFLKLNSVVTKSQLFYTERVDVRWGGQSQIEAEYVLFRSSVKGEYAYYHLISGQDLPIKTQDEIHAFFEKNEGSQFIEFTTMSANNPSFLHRVRYFHLFQERVQKNKNFLYHLEQGLLILQKLIRINRVRNLRLPLYKGSNWFSVTHDLMKELVAQEEVFKKIGRYSACADELIVQTVAMNSSYREKIVNNNMRLVDWKRGTNQSPYVFRMSDLGMIWSSEMLFARKFDENVDLEVMEEIYQKLKKEI
jgi:hypothetical protein